MGIAVYGNSAHGLEEGGRSGALNAARANVGALGEKMLTEYIITEFEDDSGKSPRIRLASPWGSSLFRLSAVVALGVMMIALSVSSLPVALLLALVPMVVAEMILTVSDHRSEDQGIEAGDGGDSVLLFSSLSIPGKKDWGVDVDTMVVSGNRAILVDAKVGKKGARYWNIGPNLMNGFGKEVDKQGKPRTLSKNMVMARSIYAEKLRPLGITSVHAAVIYVPPSRKATTPTSVRFLTYPGKIRSFLPHAGMRHIRATVKPTSTPTPPEAIGFLRSQCK